MLAMCKRLMAIALVMGIISFAWGNFDPPKAWAVDYNKRTFIQEDFSHQDLRDNSYDLSSLRGCDFSYSDLRGVRFFSANLEFVNFEGADLRGAVLDSARIGHANFKNANLEGAFLASVKITPSTVIEGADFTDALILARENDKLCELASGTNPTTGRDTAATLYCP
ncbi:MULTISPECIES: pentapeptide repeat-containing protein [unclassified Picosynechococcus]|uniref:pentapeptide repeat-containing protein n=1 Tax=unclassified Picosynechococcus TaxID=3079910 RepID=UPI00081065CB|nr:MULTISPECIES: pentapeptide repeat-containing protein [unclassified Picosynechococcus]ANV91623.1 low-complexity protein [Picosynechococcus sp. PCC 8807]QCS48543.1 pentapeptide repeat-containing protein [Picosynechococcus sp. PCC 11901]